MSPLDRLPGFTFYRPEHVATLIPPSLGQRVWDAVFPFLLAGVLTVFYAALFVGSVAFFLTLMEAVR